MKGILSNEKNELRGSSSAAGYCRTSEEKRGETVNVVLGQH